MKFILLKFIKIFYLLDHIKRKKLVDQELRKEKIDIAVIVRKCILQFRHFQIMLNNNIIYIHQIIHVIFMFLRNYKKLKLLISSFKKSI